MSQQELLASVAAALDTQRIPYFVTGSTASSFQGEPRSTHDVDLVVMIDASQVDTFVQAFPTDRFYLDPDDVRATISGGRMFNLIDTLSGDKVDFWVSRKDSFDNSRFSRRQRTSVLGNDIWVSSPEDTILAKLRWANESGGSEKQFGDALGVFEVQGGHLISTI